MATVPLSGSNIRLLTGIPFTNDYKHTRWFDSLSQQTSYFQSRNSVYDSDKHSFTKIETTYTVNVNKNIDSLWGVNYMMFQNTEYSNKWFYAFVTKLDYINKNVTKVHFLLDVFQTWLFQMNFKPSFVVREHRPLWNSDGSPVVNTVEEDLHYGSEYDLVYTHQFIPNGGYKWLVIVSKLPLEAETNKEVTPSIVGTPQPLSYYAIPFRDDNTVPHVSMNGGTGAMNFSNPNEVLHAIYKDEEAVNNVVSLYVTDYMGIPSTYTPQDGIVPPTITFDESDATLEAVFLQSGTDMYYLMKIKEVKQFKPIYGDILDNKYQMYSDVKESKLLMYPYTLTIIDDFRGNRTIIKNEYLNTSNLRLSMKGSLGTSNKTSINLPEYNRKQSDGQKLLTSNEDALINNNPNDIPIITEYLASYLQGNRNSLMNQLDSTFFNGMMGAFGGLNAGVSAAIQQNPIGVVQAGANVTQGLGNTILQIQGMEAKKQDIQNTPPSISKMGNNIAYEYGNGYNGVFIMQKEIKAEYRKKLTDFFNMFGYKINEVKIPNFHTRQYWNYIQTSSCMITGNFNTEDLNELKTIFDNGITLWHTDDIGNYALENEVI